jgi:glyoxylase-like metal-dependent hydrolase (beta-lactamase superfamily II)
MATVHHFNATTMCPIGGRLIMGGDASVFSQATLVCHCLLVETKIGLLLVDTGLYAEDDFIGHRVSPIDRAMLGAELTREELASSRVRALGHDPRDVRHVLPTHLDLDHAGGLADFPTAAVHVMQREHDAAFARRTFFERARYIPRHFADARFVRHEVSGERWKGFDAVRPFPGSGDEVLMIPLYGHTRGHAAIAVETSEGWVVHCGDAYFSKQEIARGIDAPPLLERFQRTVAIDDELRRKNRDRLRVLAEDASVRVFCAHDAGELAELSTSTG